MNTMPSRSQTLPNNFSGAEWSVLHYLIRRAKQVLGKHYLFCHERKFFLFFRSKKSKITLISESKLEKIIVSKFCLCKLLKYFVGMISKSVSSAVMKR